MRVDLGWAAYGDLGPVTHRWEYDQMTGVLRSECRSVYRRVEGVGVLRVDDAVPQCQRCKQRETARGDLSR